MAEKKKQKMMVLLEIKNEFNQPSLLYMLLFEESSKVRLSICKTISAILDGYHNDKLLLTIDGEKLEKTKIDPFKSISHQIYQIFKNLSIGVLIALLIESDEIFANHVLRVKLKFLFHIK